MTPEEILKDSFTVANLVFAAVHRIELHSGRKKEVSHGINAKTETVLIIIWCGFHSAAPDWPAVTLALIMTALTHSGSSAITGCGLNC